MATLVERLEKVAAAAVADALGRLNVMDPKINAVVPGARAAGPALTVKCFPGSVMTVHYALMNSHPGDIIVVDNEGSKGGAVFGELMCREFKQRGLGGVVIDGPVRDVTGIRDLGFPVFARYTTPRVGTNPRLGFINVPITCGGVVVNPGDYILGDDDGVVVIPGPELERIVEAAEAVEKKEEGIAASIDSGKFLCDLLSLRQGIEDQVRARESQH